MRPAVTALLDQADAAGRHSLAIMHAAAHHERTRVRYTQPGPVTTAVLRRMHRKLLAQALAGHPILCPHLSFTAPAAAAWVAHAPGKLRCTDCARAAAERINGTREDRTCDHCRKVVPRIHACAVQLPALVVDLPGLPAVASPPALVHYGLCPRCKTDEEGPST